MSDSDFRWGIVAAVSPLRVQLVGDPAALPITPDSLVDPLTLVVGARVRCELASNRVIVHGRADAAFYTRAQVNGLLTHRNQLINGAMNIWQRGISFASPATLAYTADRWQVVFDGTGATRTISRQQFTPGSEVCERPFFLRWAQTVAGSGGTVNSLVQRIEDVRTNANGTVTVSFWAKLASAANISVRVGQNFGTGGSATVTTASQTVALTTAMTRYSVTFTPASIAGKTIGYDDHFFVEFMLPLNTTFTFDITGIQAEAGLVLTPFERLPIMDVLSSCYRYYWRVNATFAGAALLSGQAVTGNIMQYNAIPPVQLRTSVPAVSQSGTLQNYRPGVVGAENLTSALSIIMAGPGIMILQASTTTSSTAGAYAVLYASTGAGQWVALDAEL